MPERTGYAHGVPSWVDLATTDTEDAKRFYGELFGWESMGVGGEQMPYTMFTKNGNVVAGMGEIQPEHQEAGYPPTWNSYINVDSCDDTVAKVNDAGGSVMVEPMDVMDTGRMAFVADSSGAAFGLWEAGTHTGAQLVNEHGSLSWNELLTSDPDAANTFYGQVFGYRAEVAETPNGPYTSWWVEGNVEGNAAAGMLKKPPEMPPGVPDYWGVYFSVDDVDAALGTVTGNGGVVHMPPMDIPGVGRMAVVADPQGAAFTIIKLISPQR